MTIFYLDTSVVIKRYRTEEGTAFVDHLFDQVFYEKEHKLVTSTLTLLEVTAALRRIQKGGLLSTKDFQRAISIFSKETDNISLRPLGEEILTKAIHVVMDHALRTADAIHLATAIEVQDIMSPFDESIILLTNDKEMFRAAKMEGIKVMKALDEKIDGLNNVLTLTK